MLKLSFTLIQKNTLERAWSANQTIIGLQVCRGTIMDVESLSGFWTFVYVDFGYIGLLSDSKNLDKIYKVQNDEIVGSQYTLGWVGVLERLMGIQVLQNKYITG